MLVNDVGDGGIFVAFAVDDVTPVAPHCADIEQDRFVLLFRACERRFSPLMPVNRLVRGGAQIGAGGTLQTIWRLRGLEMARNLFRLLDWCELLHGVAR